MFTKGKLMLIYTESLVHAGAGSGLGAIDLPVQRERITNWPIINASGLKGALREYFETRGYNTDELFAVFGPDQNKGGNPADNAGAVSFNDARVLLFPVRSLKGIFAYLTCPLALKRLKRDLEALKIVDNDQINTDFTSLNLQGFNVKDNEIFLSNGSTANSIVSDLAINIGTTHQVILEELSFDVKPDGRVTNLINWLKAQWNTNAPWIDLEKRIGIVSDDVFKDFVEFSTEVTTRNKINDETGTAADGALWSEECLPREVLLYTLILTCKSLKVGVPAFEPDPPGPNQKGSDQKVLDYVTNVPRRPERFWLGGDQTIGRGILRCHFK